MKNVRISDVTLTKAGLSFREKLEIAKLLDKTGVNIVNFGKIADEKVDLLAVRTLGPIFTDTVFACDAGSSHESAEKVASALSTAKNPRLVVSIPVSSVQMEYVCGKKPADMLAVISDMVAYCASLCADVEFEALDASRGEYDFVCSAIKAAISAGAKTVTLCDTAGNMLPSEVGALVKKLFADLPELADTSLAVSCSNKLCSANASLIEAVCAGASEVKVSALGDDMPFVKAFADTVAVKGDSLGITVSANSMNLGQVCAQIAALASDKKAGSAFDNRVGSSLSGSTLGKDTDVATLRRAVEDLGYELSDDDVVKVYEAFARIAEKKMVTPRELDAIVASAALQVPPVYRLVNYVITSGNLIGSTAHVILEKDSIQLTGLSAGNGPVDAAFLAVEQITGHHFELDDFQIQAVTEGREAVGEAIVRLRAGGMLFSGKGVSTDIVGAGLRAYVNALNKIVYEENC